MVSVVSLVLSVELEVYLGKSLTNWSNPGIFLAALVIALLVNIGSALISRHESNRWISTLLWLLLPISVGHTEIGGIWTAEAYAWAYLLVMFCLILSRSIARGVVFLSTNSPIAAFTRNASSSYVYGYASAGVLSVILSLNSSNSQIHTTAVTSVIIMALLLVTFVVEKRNDLIAILPFLAQLALWSAIRPTIDSVETYLILSTFLAIFLYAFALTLSDSSKATSYYLKSSSLVTAYLAPVSVLFIGKSTFAMAVGLFVAGLLTLHYYWNTKQDNREFSGAIVVASIMWIVWIAGVRELQVYTHIAVATLALYAYLRSIRNEIITSDHYLKCMLATATIPLALQAISGVGGGIYGWWLLLEQIVFMLIGMAIGKKFVVFWGLYVAIGSVLYQLRNLGWAALSILAIFIIGLALYQLQKNNNKQ